MIRRRRLYNVMKIKRRQSEMVQICVIISLSLNMFLNKYKYYQNKKLQCSTASLSFDPDKPRDIIDHLITLYTQIYKPSLKLLIIKLLMQNVIVPRPQSKRMRSQALGSARRTNHEQAVVYFQKAKQLHGVSQYQQALQTYAKATICDPKYFEAYCNMGACYRSLGKYSLAKNCYLKAITLNPNDPISHYNLANLFRIIGDYEQSIRHYEQVINLKQKQGKDIGDLYVNSLINVGICYKNKGLLEEAIAIYEKVNKVGGNDESGLYNQAMCLLALIQASPTPSFALVNKERAQSIQGLLYKVHSLNPNNKMVKIFQIKTDVLVSSSIDKAIAASKDLRDLLNDSAYSGLDQDIKQVITFCQQYQTFLKKAEKSEYSYDSRYTIERQIESNIVVQDKFVDLFLEYAPEPAHESKASITQTEAIRLLKNHNYKQVQERLKDMPSNSLLVKSIKLIMYVSKAQFNGKYLDRAYQFYEKQLQGPFKEGSVTFVDLSLQVHKAIGQIYNHKKMFIEAARHFQFVSSSLKEQRDVIASEHHIVAEGLDTAGNLQKALEEYKIAFELEPSNEIMSHNLGCCLLECGQYKEAIKYFEIFMEIVRNKVGITEEEREEEITECFILIALASSGQPTELDAYYRAYDKLLRLRQLKGATQLPEENMLSFFVNFSELIEGKYLTLRPSSEDFIETRQLLLDVYQNLLEFKNCPDREQIFINAGNLSYDSKLYLKAAGFYLSVSTSFLLPYRKIALCYLHLYEPAMTLKFMEEEEKINKDSPLCIFTMQIIEWIYYNVNQGKYASRLPRTREELFYERNAYGAALIEKLDIRLKDIGSENKEILERQIDEFIKNPGYIRLLEPYQNVKYEKIKTLIEQTSTKEEVSNPRDLIPKDILKICFNQSENIENDLKKLYKYFQGMTTTRIQVKIIEALIYLFCYYNFTKRQAVHELFVLKMARKREKLILNLNKVIDSNETVYSIMPDFTSTKKLVAMMRQWEQVLQPKIRLLLAAIETLYYQSNMTSALAFQYNFPRHTQFLESEETFQKLLLVMGRIIPMQKSVTYKSKKLLEMKKQLVLGYENYYNQYVKKAKIRALSLSETFTPLIVYSNHKNKQEAEKFIGALFDLSSQAKFKPVNCDQYTVVINKLIQLRCRWRDPLSQETLINQILEQIVESPLDEVNQSILALQKLLEVVRENSREGGQFIDRDLTLRR